MKFHYKAKKVSGEDLEGVKESSDKFTLARELRAQGLIVVSAEPELAQSTKEKAVWYQFLRHVSLKDRIVFAGNLSAMMSSGLSLGRALSVLERQTKNKYFKEVIKSVGDKINAGSSLSSALSEHPKVFPEVFVAMVASAEETGNLPEALKIVSEQMTKTYELRKKVRGAMIYPAIIVTAIIIVGVLMMTFLIPTLTATFRELGTELPLSTRLVIALSDFMVNYFLLLVLALLTLVISLFYALKTERGREILGAVILKSPLFGDMSRKINSAIVMRTVSSLISAGVSMTKTIEISQKVVQNRSFRKVLTEAQEKIQKGIPLSEVFKIHEELFPIFVGEMTTVGEETGKLPEMMMKGALFFEDEVDQVTKNLSSVIEPILMVIIGLAVGLFALSMIGPMYSLSEAF